MKNPRDDERRPRHVQDWNETHWRIWLEEIDEAMGERVEQVADRLVMDQMAQWYMQLPHPGYPIPQAPPPPSPKWRESSTEYEFYALWKERLAQIGRQYGIEAK